MDMSGFVGGVGVGSVIGGLVVGSSAGVASVGKGVMGLEGVGADLGHVSSVAGTKSSCFT